MKKIFAFSLGLCIIDQIIKLLIAKYCINVNIILIQNILFLHPVKNTNLNWIANMLEYQTPVLLMIFIQICILLVMLITYRYLSYLRVQGKRLLNIMLMFFAAGILCSFVDVVFWGGSLDFLRLFNWFTFDLKDVYLDIGLAFLLLYTVIYYTKSYHPKSKVERKQAGLWPWIKKGMPLLQNEDDK